MNAPIDGTQGQTNCVEFEVTGELDGTTLSPPFDLTEGTDDAQQIYRVGPLESLGLIDPDLISLGDEDERSGASGNRWISFLWIKGPSPGLPDAQVSVVDRTSGVPILQEELVSFVGDDRVYLRNGIFLPQGSMIQLDGLEATPGSPIIVRLHIAPLTNEQEQLVAIALLPRTVDLTIQQDGVDVTDETSVINFTGDVLVTLTAPGEVDVEVQGLLRRPLAELEALGSATTPIAVQEGTPAFDTTNNLYVYATTVVANSSIWGTKERSTKQPQIASTSTSNLLRFASWGSTTIGTAANQAGCTFLCLKPLRILSIGIYVTTVPGITAISVHLNGNAVALETVTLDVPGATMVIFPFSALATFNEGDYLAIGQDPTNARVNLGNDIMSVEVEEIFTVES